jgi:multiple sugar transport system substrate-binding protein
MPVGHGQEGISGIMKWVLLATLVGAIALTVWAKVTVPVEHVNGVAKLVWATDDNPARQEQMALFKQWHLKHYGEPIEIIIDPNNTSHDKVVIQSLAGVGPDLFDFSGNSDLERYIKSGILLEVTDAAKAQGFSYQLVWPSIKSSFVTQEGRQYGFPDNAAAYMLIYNKDMFDKAGVPYPKPGWTWDEFLQTAQRLSGKRPDGMPQYAIANVQAMEMIHQNGGQIFSPEGTHCTLNSPEALYALQYYADLSHKYHVMPTASETNSISSAGGWGGGTTSQFTAKYLAMYETGRWTFTGFAKDAGTIAFDLGVAEVPCFKQQWVDGWARSTGINRNSHNVKYALRFLEFLASEEFNKEVNSRFDSTATVMKYDQGPTGIAAGAPPPKGLESANDPLWMKAFAYAHDMDSSPFVPPYRVGDLWTEAVGNLDAQVTTPAETLRDYAQKIDDEIQRNVAKDPLLRAQYQQALAKEGHR